MGSHPKTMSESVVRDPRQRLQLVHERRGIGPVVPSLHRDVLPGLERPSVNAGETARTDETVLREIVSSRPELGDLEHIRQRGAALVNVCENRPTSSEFSGCRTWVQRFFHFLAMRCAEFSFGSLKK